MLAIRLAGLFACVIVQSHSALAQEAAIARCTATGVVAVATGQTLSEAGGNATTNCVLSGGQQVCCQVVVDTQQWDCIAFAQGPGRESAGYGNTRDEAKFDAFAYCGDGCQVAAALCRY